jgi:hypothetical protein
MSPQILQSLISTQRNKIHDLHRGITYFKRDAKEFYLQGNEDAARSFMDCVRQDTKRIAKLVRIQKALKKELADAIDFERFMRNFPDAVEAYNLYEIDSHI